MDVESAVTSEGIWSQREVRPSSNPLLIRVKVPNWDGMDPESELKSK